MKAVILEDERIATERLKRMVVDLAPHIEIIAQYTSIAELINHINLHDQPDILFLDIQVEDGNSMEIFDLAEIKCHVIFTTAYDHYAVDAFRKNAIDYLLKPIKKNQLKQAIDKLKTHNIQVIKDLYQNQEQHNPKFIINFGARLYRVLHSDIAYVYSENKISYFVLKNGDRIPSDFKLQELYPQLEQSEFFRLNRQVIAHMSAIKEILKHTKSRLKIKLAPPFHKEIVISNETTPKFKNWIK